MWKPINGYEDLYEVSQNGDVKSLLKNRLLKPWKHKKGYLVITLTKDKKHKHFYVHRLVAEAFLENKRSKGEVNHIDGNKKNNRLNNLEWCDGLENRKHAYENGLRKMQGDIKVAVVSKNGSVIAKFDSLSEASRKTGVSLTAISRRCSGYKGEIKGFTFERVV